MSAKQTACLLDKDGNLHVLFFSWKVVGGDYDTTKNPVVVADMMPKTEIYDIWKSGVVNNNLVAAIKETRRFLSAYNTHQCSLREAKEITDWIMANLTFEEEVILTVKQNAS